MSTMLFVSPHWYAFEAPLGIPYICGYLKSRGKDVRQKDLNLECQDYFLSRKYLEECCREIKKKDIEYDYPAYVLDNIDISKANTRNANVSIDVYIKSFDVLEKAYEIISKRWYPTKISFDNFTMPYNEKESLCIKEAIDDSEHNPYIQFYEECVLNKIDETTDIIAISILGQQQLIPGITLAAMIKRKHPKVKIVLGGTVFTILKKTIQKWKHLFDFFDFIILYEGEESMYQLISALENGESIININNLVYRNENKELVIQENTQINTSIDLAIPCFEGLELDKYFVPRKIIPFALTRQKCTWSRCAFCVHDISISNNFKLKQMDKIVEEIRYLINKYDTDLFDLLIENGLNEKVLEEFSRELLRKNVKIKWRAHFRLQREIDFNLLKKSGCVALFCGVESGSDQVLENMRKGTSVSGYEKCLKHIMEAGIWTRISLIIGFPNETLNDVLQTFKFLIKNKNNIGSFGAGRFMLYLDSGVFNNLEHYNVEVITNESQDMALWFEYSTTNNYDIEKIEKQLISLTRQNYAESNFWRRIPGTVLFNFLTRYNSAQEAKSDFLKYKNI
ncbi:B12-binding domain-containing radical SAM protein [Sporanaerobacter acetigenes]|uniref:Radical SAM superfamily enzyme YgiQ, UPF0313 family n=1 Tax=Sporanaerobacter acetigenes DSM 13106 TaxID=1123281 RepID=A0A1M5Z8S0_9FIRM|nr:radical SAM protein [Sporanaerobacter acetigenes]SHI20626.1 Radical SAM superfamily enzyme YgiQ, UPF0313 family [Sporanaerobacter acetigenes DSM 13106]